MAELLFRYTYAFGDGTRKQFEARIDEATMNLIAPRRADLPAWTDLLFYRCPNCPLDEKQNVHCPSAVALVEVVESFKDRVSHEKVTVTVETPNRSYTHHAPLHVGLSSLIGIYMATGGCPVMNRLKPMARFHLPFADEEETMFRAMSAYLLGQYFIMRKGGEPDWRMDKLVDMYDEIKAVNQSFCNRLRQVSTRDSNVNAVIGLDCFADAVIFSISQAFLDQLEQLYHSYRA